HPVVRVAFVDLKNLVELVFCLRESAGPSQDARAPRANIHVVGGKSDLLINNPQGVVPIVGVGIFSGLSLPNLSRLLC
ncbi:MAG: hypothetical protein ABSH13_05895, partial [Candidatus Acidiferrum sp.]